MIDREGTLNDSYIISYYKNLDYEFNKKSKKYIIVI